MSCERYLDLISARLDGPLSQQDEAELTAHLNTCPDCRAIARDLEGIHTALTGCTVPPPTELSEVVMNTIRGRRTARKRIFRQLGALAACLVLCLGVWRMAQPGTAEAPAGVPDMARHAQPFALTEDLPFSNEQRIRVSDTGSYPAPSAILLNSTDSLARCLGRFSGNGLSDVAQTYDEEYFRTHRLLAVVVCESSSSISHTIFNLTEDSVAILRHVPETGDCDMALWLILAEVEGAGPETSLDIELLAN